MKELLNKWLYLDLLFYKDEFQEINKLDLVHPMDVERFKSNPMDRLYECIGVDEEYLLIKGRHAEYRVKKEAVKQLMPTPAFKWGDRVILRSQQNLDTVISDFFWHHKDQKYYYHISENGKRKSNRFSDGDLLKRNLN